MTQLNRPQDGEDGKLRRWVSNLQLESWQLELLITGFSIFLLATSIEEYEQFSQSINFNKLVASPDASAVFVASGRFIIGTVPLAIKFFLISLLVHLLLRGFWIGIVGLSSVSNKIDFDGLKLQGKFRKRLPGMVRTLDELILFLDKVSSVIFAYTFLLAFSILSVVIVASFLFSVMGLTTYLGTLMSNPAAVAITSFIGFFMALFLAICAILFFLDTLLFSAFKKSKWFSTLYYPVYRFFSIISLSFLYRSIYYHLITNYKKKQIIGVIGVLLFIWFISYRIDRWDTYSFFPETISENEFIIQKSHYDDERKGGYIRTASLPSRFIKNDYLEVFIRYSPRDNRILELICEDYKGLKRDPSFMDGIRAGIESQTDTTKTLEELLGTDEQYEQLVKQSTLCFGEMYEVWLNGKKLENQEYFFTRHENKAERGIANVMDISYLERGRHLITIKRYSITGNPVFGELTADRLKMESFVKIPFWKE